MSRVESLTAEQEAALPLVRDEWLRFGLCTDPADRPAAEAGVRAAYEAAGLTPPRLVVWLGSPLAGAVGAAMLAGVGNRQVWAQVRDQVEDQVEAQVWRQVGAQVRDQVRGQVWAQVRDQVRDQVEDQVEAQVWRQVGAQVRDQVRGQVWAQVRDQVRGQVWAQVWAQVRDQVRGQVWAQVRGQVRGQVGDQVWAQVGGQVGGQVWDQVQDQVGDQVEAQVEAQVWAQVQDQVRHACYGQHDAGWLSFYAAMPAQVAGPERLDGLMSVARSAGWWWPFTGAVILTERPNLLLRDQQGRLHCETGPAMTYPDGWGIHAWHGTRVPADLIETGWDTDRILREPNAEVRRCAIERMGWPEFIAAAGLAQVGGAVPDPGNPGQTIALYDVPEQIYDEPVRVLVATNGTPERDGTRRTFGLTVPDDIADPVAAAAWTYDLDAREYARLEHRR